MLARATAIFGKNAGRRFLAGHPMAGKEQSGVEVADPDLFQGAAWFFTPPPDRTYSGLSGEFLEWVEKIGARVASMDADAHDELCAWISHLPQLISTALAATLVDEFGENAPLLETGGRALREMTRISASPYSMWRDIALTNKKNISAGPAQAGTAPGAHPRKPGYAELALEFEQAHHLRKTSPQRHRDTEKTKQMKISRCLCASVVVLADFRFRILRFRK